MEIFIPEENDNTKHKKVIDKLNNLKNQYLISYNKSCFTNNEILFQLDSYINLIQNMNFNININNIHIFLNLLFDFSCFINNKLNNNFEEKNHFYLKYAEFNESILDKINNLNYTNKLIVIKIKRRIDEMTNNCLRNKELKLYMNINDINSIEEYIKNPVFIKYINDIILKNIKRINNMYNKYIKYYEKNNSTFNEINYINRDFINQIKKCVIICKDMKNKYFCNKYMKNTEDNTIKIHNNIYNCYIKVLYDYLIKLSQIIIKKISEQNLKLFNLNNNPGKILKEEKEIIHPSNNIDNLNSILNEGFTQVEGKLEYINKKENYINVIDLDDEFGEEKNNINNNINDHYGFEERKKHYQNLFDINIKLSEENKNNEYIILNLTKFVKDFNNKIKERENNKNLLEIKYNQILKQNRENLYKEKKIIENESNNLKLKGKEYELKLIELKTKYEKKDINDSIEKKEEIKINNNTENKKENIIIDIKPKERNIFEENKKLNYNKNIDINNKINKEKLITLFNSDMPLKKETSLIKPQKEINNEENNKDNSINNNINILNQENNVVNNNPFSGGEEKEDDKILKQVKALDNLSSVLSNRTNSKNKKESFSPSPRIINRGIHNENNISMIFSGLNINENKLGSNNKNNINDKMKNIKDPFIFKSESTNIFSQINTNNNNNLNSKEINKKTESNNIFDFNSNINNPFNTIINNKPNPFSFKPSNNISKSYNIISQPQNTLNNGQNNIFKNLNISSNNNTGDNIFPKLTFGMHNSTLITQGNNNFNMNSINISFGNNNLNGQNNNNSFSPFTQFSTNQGLNNLVNDTQNKNDDNYF